MGSNITIRLRALLFFGLYLSVLLSCGVDEVIEFQHADSAKFRETQNYLEAGKSILLTPSSVVLSDLSYGPRMFVWVRVCSNEFDKPSRIDVELSCGTKNLSINRVEMNYDDDGKYPHSWKGKVARLDEEFTRQCENQKEIILTINVHQGSPETISLYEHVHVRKIEKYLKVPT